MRMILSVIAAALLFGLSGVYHGLRSDRWGTSDDLSRAVGRLQRIPISCGKWSGEPVHLDEAALRRAEASGWIARKYVHPEKGEVQLLVLCGRPGPISVHTPEICYPGIGYALFDKAERVEITPSDGMPALQFWTTRFSRPGVVTDALRIAWAWNSAGSFVAAEHPRIRFGADRYLYKIYVVERLTQFDEPWEHGRCNAFLKDLLPEIDRALCPISEVAGTDAR